jgi:hypothetical protein
MGWNSQESVVATGQWYVLARVPAIYRTGVVLDKRPWQCSPKVPIS